MTSPLLKSKTEERNQSPKESEPRSPVAKRCRIEEASSEIEQNCEKVKNGVDSSPKVDKPQIEANGSPTPVNHAKEDADDKQFFPNLLAPTTNINGKVETLLEETPKENNPTASKESPKAAELESISSAQSPQPAEIIPFPTLEISDIRRETYFPKRRQVRKPKNWLKRQRKDSPEIEILSETAPQPVIPLPNAAFSKPITPLLNMIVNFPKELANDFPRFKSMMCQWQWETIDHVQLPVVLRGSQKFIAYTIAHIKLLSKFPPHVNVTQIVPADIALSGIAMTETEAWMLNFINTTVCNYELGIHVFQNGDILMELENMELLYIFTKKHHLEELLRIYDGAVPEGALTDCKNIIGAIRSLRNQILEDIKKINQQIKIKYRPRNQLQSHYSSPPQQQTL